MVHKKNVKKKPYYYFVFGSVSLDFNYRSQTKRAWKNTAH